MNIEEHLLTVLIEECAEVSQHTCKALRFGIDDRDPTRESAPTEREQIIYEINDIIAVSELLMEHATFSTLLDRSLIEAKKAKVIKFLNYAREHGALN